MFNQMASETKFAINNPDKSTEHAIWSAKIALWDAFVTEPVVMSSALHILISSLSLQDWHVVSPIHLFLFLNISRTSRMVLQAVTKHISQILVTMLFMIFLLIFFATWLMRSFGNGYWHEEFPGLTCKSLWNCFIYTFDYGVRHGGGIGEVLQVIAPGDNWLMKFLFDFAFFLVINIIC